MLLSTLGPGRPGADTADGKDDGVSNADVDGDTQGTNETPEPLDTPGMEVRVLEFFIHLALIAGSSVSLVNTDIIKIDVSTRLDLLLKHTNVYFPLKVLNVEIN